MSRRHVWIAAVIAAMTCGVHAFADAGEPSQKDRRQAEDKKESSAADSGDRESQSTERQKRRTWSLAEAARRARESKDVSPAIKAATKKDAADGEGRIVITNEVLERMFGPARATSSGSPQYDGVTVAGDGQASGGQAGRDGSGKGADQSAGSGKSPAERAAEIESEIDRLRKRILGMRNPYLPRGKATEEEREKEKGKDNAERVKMLEEKIDRLEQELLSLRENSANPR